MGKGDQDEDDFGPDDDDSGRIVSEDEANEDGEDVQSQLSEGAA